VRIDKSGIGDFEMPLIFNPEQNGLAKVLRDYQQEALISVWKNGENGLTSREVYEYVNGKIEGSISRASIINFLKAMADEGVLSYTERTGKGGYHRVYTSRLNESEFKKHLAQIMISSLMKDYPKETREVIKSIKELIFPARKRRTFCVARALGEICFLGEDRISINYDFCSYFK
jgi:predicted transcriptional regulator